MSERAMRLRLGGFVLVVLVLLGVMILLFSRTTTWFGRHNAYTVVLNDASGVAAGTLVRRSGVRVGEVESLDLNDETGEVYVRILLDRKYVVRHNEQAVLERTILGETSIALKPIKSEDRSPIEPGAEIQGEVEPDARTLMNRAAEIAPSAEESLAAFGQLARRLDRMDPPIDQTNREIRDLTRDMRATLPEVRRTNKELGETVQTWGKVGGRLDDLLRTNDGKNDGKNQQGKVDRMIDTLNSVLTQMNKLLSDENVQNASVTLKNMRTGSERFPSVMENAEGLFKESRQTLKQMDSTLTQANQLMTTMQETLRPFSERSDGWFRSFDEVTDRTIRVLAEMEGLLQVINHGEGTIQRLMSDPSLYDGLNEITGFAVHSLPQIDRMLRDMQVFIDKIARHPELIGAGGLIRPSNGTKEAPPHGPIMVCPRPPG
jgi:phospholipid/cholesterol/gamma-HCH transport system substrate-binding protein